MRNFSQNANFILQKKLQFANITLERSVSALSHCDFFWVGPSHMGPFLKQPVTMAKLAKKGEKP
jgi:hypothetical protein